MTEALRSPGESTSAEPSASSNMAHLPCITPELRGSDQSIDQEHKHSNSTSKTKSKGKSMSRKES